MDNRFETRFKELDIQYDEWKFHEGFKFAIQRLRENKYYGHYAQNLADWLEKHLTEQVPEPTITSLKGDK